jgi:hypothetical protein
LEFVTVLSARSPRGCGEATADRHPRNVIHGNSYRRDVMRRALATVCTVAMAFLAGCGSDGPTLPTQASVAGTWNLTTVNGATLPFTLQASPKVEVLSDQLIVAANGTFTESTQLRLTDGTTVTTTTVPDGGTYTLSGTSATLNFNDGTQAAGIVSGNTFTVALSGLSLVWKKQ